MFCYHLIYKKLCFESYFKSADNAAQISKSVCRVSRKGYHLDINATNINPHIKSECYENNGLYGFINMDAKLEELLEVFPFFRKYD